ncbi:hypothetical protein AURDEDRAFT_115318 [Auricularia subglabra TFB-10046 SS5]|nr:hypothetical protein AURDEDRAFT_115318 [Auricularia subglabra TFB-10046 SS5]
MWKTRFALNYKNVQYRSEWVSYPDIEQKMKQIGAQPTAKRADGSPLYTLPVIHDLDRNLVVADSATIAEYLDAHYPARPLFPPNTRALQASVSSYLNANLLPSFRPLVVPSVVYILDKPGAEYFRRTREAAFGCALEDILPAGEKRKEHWKGVFKALDEISSWFDGPWLGGDKPVYADFVLGAWLQWMRKVTTAIPGGDGWERVKDANGGQWARFMENLEPYMATP